MNKTENISANPSRAIWFWGVGFLTLLILVTAIAIPLGQNYRAIKHVESLGGVEGFRRVVATEPNFMLKALPESWQEWLRNSLGEGIQTFETVVSITLINSSINDDDLRYLKRFTNPYYLSISNTKITDAGLIQLKGFTKLNVLCIYNSQITDDGLIHLKGFTNLIHLVISNAQITDDGLSHLKGRTNLKILDISRTQITDDGLIHLKGLTKLNYLHIHKTQVTKEGVAELQTALPNCKINYTSASP